jgi:prolyl-tRNA synthetase
LQSSIVQVNNLGEFEQAINQQKIALCYWAGTIEDEEKIKKQSHVAPRCVLDQTPKQLINKKCFYTNHPAKQLVYFARAY